MVRPITLLERAIRQYCDYYSCPRWALFIDPETNRRSCQYHLKNIQERNDEWSVVKPLSPAQGVVEQHS